MDLKATAKHVEVFVRNNSPEIMSGLAVSGVATTAYLSHQTGVKAAKACRREDDLRFARKTPALSRKEAAKLLWKIYIPPAIVGTATATLIILSTRSAHRRTAAMTAAYSLSERAFSEYKDKVREKLGERKEQGVRDAIAEDKVRNNPPGDKVLVVDGSGNSLCYELHTGRPFISSMEALKKAENELNARLLREDFAYIHNFYDLVGIPHTDSDYDFGWTSDKLMELEFTSLIHNDKPVLAFAYNYYKPL